LKEYFFPDDLSIISPPIPPEEEEKKIKKKFEKGFLWSFHDFHLFA
jgi:hypothetical protein